MKYPIKCFDQPHKLFNVDGTENKAGDLLYYTDLSVQTGFRRVTMRFMLSDLGDQNCILGYPWFAAMQPRIDWAKGWLDHDQLPIVIRSPDAQRAQFVSRNHQRARTATQIHQIKDHVEETRKSIQKRIPQWCSDYWKVFSDHEAQRFPPSRPWDHKIELLPDAPTVIKSRVFPLSQAELQEQAKFIERDG